MESGCKLELYWLSYRQFAPANTLLFSETRCIISGTVVQLTKESSAAALVKRDDVS